MAGMTRRVPRGTTGATLALLLSSTGIASAADSGSQPASPAADAATNSRSLTGSDAASVAGSVAGSVAAAPALHARAAAQPVLRPGDRGPQVAALQRRLAALRYWLGTEPVDGHFGPLTVQAVYALQKAAGISRDGIVGPSTRSALTRGVKPRPRSTTGHLIEVDLNRQLLMLVDRGRLIHTFNTSAGTFKYYTFEGRRYLADTPRGRWRIYRQVNGWRTSDLGRLYRPKYFHTDGIAIHGYGSVPPYAASHGCVRVSFAAMDWFWNRGQLPMGRNVWVY